MTAGSSPGQGWRVPIEWSGETAFLLGGGQSLKGFDAEQLRGKGRVIAINDAGLVMAPWADVLLWSDAAWLEWNIDDLHLHVGPYKISRVPLTQRTDKCPPAVKLRIARETARLGVKVIARECKRVLGSDPGKLGGKCGGSAAIDLARLFGARRIVLLGYDMTPGHWHGRHQRTSKPDIYERRYLPAIEAMAPLLRAREIEVINCTPGSLLECFACAELSEALAGRRRRGRRTAA